MLRPRLLLWAKTKKEYHLVLLLYGVLLSFFFSLLANVTYVDGLYNKANTGEPYIDNGNGGHKISRQSKKEKEQINVINTNDSKVNTRSFFYVKNYGHCGIISHFRVLLTLTICILIIISTASRLNSGQLNA